MYKSRVCDIVCLVAFAVSVYAKGVNVAEVVSTATYSVEPATTLEQVTAENVPFTEESTVNSTTNENKTSNEESLNMKVIDNEEIKAPESASKVMLPVVSKLTFNNVKYQTKTKHETTKEPKFSIADVIERQRIQKKNDIRAHVQYDEVTGELIDGEHPCHRDCKEGEEPMICYYHFNLEWYQTMSKACYNCPYNLDDCKRLDCIPADGMNRALNVINRKMPGPAIEVCQHDRIIVDVENDLMTEGTTVHWHGQHQRGTPFMDGTPYVTQCPIPAESTFRYQFNATHSGTHFWHSHSGMQRADGAAGALIIRKPKSQDPHGALYDYDRLEHVMIVTDWIHLLSVEMFTDHHHSSGDNKPPTLLINGVGRFKIFNDTVTPPMYMQSARFNVEKGYKYRFRVINAEFLNCPIEMSVDGHNITVIASDGYELEPITATSLVTYAGERYDFVLEANNEIDNYWIRFRGLMDCDERFTKAKQVAVLHYEGAMDLEPSGDPTWEELHNEGLQLNALNKGEEEDETISVAEMKSLQGYDDSLKEIPDYQFYVAYDFYAKNNSHFHRSPYYGYYQVPNATNRLYTPQLNHISMKMPSSPLLLTRPSSDNFCNASSIDESCKEDYCECSHVLSVKKDAIVEVIIVDEGVTFDANHPFHLHGHNFRVVGMRRLSNKTTIEEVKAFDEAGFLKRNLINAPLKDTVTVPDGGYTVIRFKADNPGYWLFHCHIEFHVEVGMALIFKVGEHKDMAPIPHDFPRCGSYLPDNMLEHHTTPTPNPDDNQVITITNWWPIFYVNGTSSTVLIKSSPILLCLIWVFQLVIGTYQFNATHSGTHFWHSHSGMQRADGAAGALIIRKPKSQDPHGALYDYDRLEHVMIVTDWIHLLSVEMFTDHHHSSGDNKPPTLLINGVGRFKIFNDTVTPPMYMQSARFNVEKGYKYRFRVINAEFLNCPIEMSVDGHNITVIASDGYELEPITATSLVTYAGERYDFVLEANNEIDNYWIRFRGLMDCDERFTKAKQVAVLHYEGAMDLEPSGDPTWEELHNEGLQLNALNKGEEEDETISVAEMKSLQGYDDSLKEIPDYQFYVAYDFYAKNNSHFHRSPYYGYYQVPNATNRLYTPQLNHISMKMPSSPLLLTRPSSDNFCNASSIDESCKEDYCECSHVLSVKKDAIVEVIIVDEGVTFDANHPFHLHGHNFRVVGMRRLSNKTTIEEVKAFDEAGFLKRNLINAPLKDTVTVPDGGYTVIRFKADNPGYWLFHCHIEFHVEVGMALIFKVGEHKDMAPIPHDFPRCGSYLPDNMLEHHTTPTPNPDDNQVITITNWWPIFYVNGTSSTVLIKSSPILLCLIWVFQLVIGT